VVIGDRVELVFGAISDERGHRDPGDLGSGCVDAIRPVSLGDRLSCFRGG
jgi:hypothetical protein